MSSASPVRRFGRSNNGGHSEKHQEIVNTSFSALVFSSAMRIMKVILIFFLSERLCIMFPGFKLLLLLLGISNDVDREQSQPQDTGASPNLHNDMLPTSTRTCGKKRYPTQQDVPQNIPYVSHDQISHPTPIIQLFQDRASHCSLAQVRTRRPSTSGWRGRERPD